MSKFMFIYRAESSDQAPSPEEMQEIMGRWMSWIEVGMKQGWMSDAGDALTPAGVVVRNSDVVTDGPFAESKELVNGYSVVEADSLQAAAALAKDCPIYSAGGCVEIRELALVGA